MPDRLNDALALPGIGWLMIVLLLAGLVRGFSGFGSALIIINYFTITNITFIFPNNIHR